MRTVKREKVRGSVYRLASLGWSRGYAIQVLTSKKKYETIENLGWVNESEARQIFREFVSIA